ncbi:4Fe-4S binding protein [Desulfovibrio sp. OttesenSCG-928-G15]|nr:4Fe-4S binding protein [Desulfovibrio sp. OttesenSCG-928-G15]
MLDVFIERLRQKKRTVPYPAKLPSLPARFRGRPFIDSALCRGKTEGCTACFDACPIGAIQREDDLPALDMGVCTFCGQCAKACPAGALVFTNDWRLGSTDRQALVIRPQGYPPGKSGTVVQSYPEKKDRAFLLPELPIVAPEGTAGLFSKSFRLRQVTAAGCGACEADLNVLATVVFDIARFGMDFVASPRHADGLVLTGPVPENMREALVKCLYSMAEPRFVLAVGACAISGGLFRSTPGKENPTGAEGCANIVAPSLYIPGCPPHPYTSLDAFLRFIGRKVPALS